MNEANCRRCETFDVAFKEAPYKSHAEVIDSLLLIFLNAAFMGRISHSLVFCLY